MKPVKKSAISGMGGITVFMVLAVLTIAVFSVLTLTSAMADTNLSQKHAGLVAAYYETDALGIDLLAALEGVWPEGEAMPGESEFLAVAAAAAPGSQATVWQMESSVLFFCTLEADESRYLEIEAELGAQGDQRWQITKWVFMTAPQEEVDEYLPVWQNN